jgi:hypothetical protein
VAQTPAETAAPDAIPYPANATSQADVQAWIDRYLPTQGYVVGAWSANVVMLVAIGALDDSHFPLVTTKVLSEVLTPDAAKAAGWRAAEQVETFACDRDVYQVLSSLYYARGDRKDRPDIEAGQDGWTAPEPGATMDTVERAACFYGQRQHAVRALAQPPGSAPAHAAPSAKPSPAARSPSVKRRRHRPKARKAKLRQTET